MSEPNEDSTRVTGTYGTVSSVDALLGRNLADLRRAADMTQTDLADAFQRAPLVPEAWRHQGVISNAEKGRRRFTVEDLIALSAFFGVPFSMFFRGHPLANVAVGAESLSVLIFMTLGGLDLETFGDRMGLTGAVEDRPWLRYIEEGHPPEEAFRLARDDRFLGQQGAGESAGEQPRANEVEKESQ